MTVAVIHILLNRGEQALFEGNGGVVGSFFSGTPPPPPPPLVLNSFPLKSIQSTAVTGITVLNSCFMFFSHTQTQPEKKKKRKNVLSSFDRLKTGSVNPEHFLPESSLEYKNSQT